MRTNPDLDIIGEHILNVKLHLLCIETLQLCRVFSKCLRSEFSGYTSNFEWFQNIFYVHTDESLFEKEWIILARECLCVWPYRETCRQHVYKRNIQHFDFTELLLISWIETPDVFINLNLKVVIHMSKNGYTYE